MGFDYRTSTGLGKQTLAGHQQNLVCTRSWEKGAVSPQETEPDLPVHPGVSGGTHTSICMYTHKCIHIYLNVSISLYLLN